MQLLNEIWIQVVVAVGIFPLVYTVFKTAEDNMSEEVKKRVAAAVRTFDFKERPGGVSVRDIYQSVFSSRHFSLRCICAVLVVSIICYLLTLLSLPGMRYYFLDNPARYLTEVMLLSLFINFVADFIALGVMRLFVKRIEVASGRTKLAMFVMDAGIKFVLVSVVAYLSLYGLGLMEGWQMGSPADFIKQLRDTEASRFVSYFVPVTLSSLWIWVYAGCLNVLPRLVAGLRWLVDFESHAVRSVGLVTAGTTSLLTFVFLFATTFAGDLPLVATADWKDCQVPLETPNIIPACTRIIEGRRRSVERAAAYTFRGITYMHKREFEQAIADCSEAVKLSPDNSAGYVCRAGAYSEKGDYDRGIADLDEAIRLAPLAGGPLHMRGITYLRKEDFDRALADFTSALRLDPNHAESYVLRGQAYYAKGELDRAIADFTSALRLDPSHAKSYVLRGQTYYAKGELDRAVADFSEAIRLAPKRIEYYARRSSAWTAKGDYDRGIADLTEAIRLEPANAALYGVRGAHHFYKGNFFAAAADLLRANDLGNDPHAMLWRYLARARLRQESAAELGANAARLKTKDWPYAVIDFYLGRRSLAEMRAAAKPVEKCKAEFYAGQWHLLRGNNAEARRALMLAVAPTCPKGNLEYDGAVAELKRLRP